jgi:N6-adenosine-specific RNA methylase IME4
MTPEDLRAMQPAAAESCALFMWTIDSMLPDALRLINAWDFTFKTVAFTWVKTNGKQSSLFYDNPGTSTGMGYWTRKNCEMVLLATRGKPRRISKSVKQTIFAPRREHSRKPIEIYDRIEALVGGPRLEMFARHIRPGWDAFGDQLGKF